MKFQHNFFLTVPSEISDMCMISCTRCWDTLTYQNYSTTRKCHKNVIDLLLTLSQVVGPYKIHIIAFAFVSYPPYCTLWSQQWTSIAQVFFLHYFQLKFPHVYNDYWLNFDIGKNNEIHYHRQKENLKI